MIEWRLHQVIADRRMLGKDVAAAIGIQANSLSRMRKRRRPGRTEEAMLDALCKCLKCQPGDLMVYVEESADREESNS